MLDADAGSVPGRGDQAGARLREVEEAPLTGPSVSVPASSRSTRASFGDVEVPKRGPKRVKARG